MIIQNQSIGRANSALLCGKSHRKQDGRHRDRPKQKRQPVHESYRIGRWRGGQGLHCCMDLAYRMSMGWQQRIDGEQGRTRQRGRHQHRMQRKGCCGLAGCEEI